MLRLRIISILNSLINVLLSVIAFFLTMRILFLFFSANPSTPVVSWILEISSFLMIPFAGMVRNLSVSTGILDIVALITLTVYVLIGYLVMAVLNSVWNETIVDEEEIEAHTGHTALAHHYHDR